MDESKFIETVVYASRKKNFVLFVAFLVSLIIPGIGFYMSAQQSDKSILILILSILLAPVFIAGFIVSLLRFIKPRKALVISSEGIADYMLFGIPCFLFWPEIKGVMYEGINGVECLGIYVVNPNEVLRRISPSIRWLIKTNLVSYGALIYISQNILDMPLSEVKKIIDNNLKVYKEIDN